MIKEYYREFKVVNNELDQEGTPFSYLETIKEPEETRISKELSVIIVKLISELKKRFEIKQVLHFSNSTIGIFNTIAGPEIKHYYLDYGKNSLEAFKEQRDQLILCDLSAEEEQISPPPYQALNKCIRRIKETDIAVVAASELNISTFRSIIEKNNASINCIFYINLNINFSKYTEILDIKGSIFIPFETGIYLLLIQKKANKNECIFHIDEAKNIKKIIEEFVSSDKTDNLIYGKMLNPGEYIGEKAYHRSLKVNEALRMIEKISIDYKIYPRKNIRELALSLLIKEFEKKKTTIELGNFLYINIIDFELQDKEKPLFSNYFKFSMQPEKILNNKYYLSIEFDSTQVDSEYFNYFFDSKIGSLIRESLSSNEYISLEDIKSLWIYMPPLEFQREILSTIHKIEDSKKNLHEINFDLILNPSAFYEATKKINKILDVFGELADFEKVKSGIYEGESKTLEFKQTFSIDISTHKKEKYIEDASIKTIAAFMNSDGGVLIVGVADNGDLIGLENEINKFYKNNDSFLLHVKNAIKNRIGEQFYPFIDYRLVELENKVILYVECLPSNSAVYVDSKDFYVRTNPATDKLEGPKLVSYINNHQNFLQHHKS